MNIVVARSVKHISDEDLRKNCFIIFGNFTFLHFKKIISNQDSDQFNELSDDLYSCGQYKGSMNQHCLFDLDTFSDNDYELDALLDPGSLLEPENEYPLCVMVTIEDKPLPDRRDGEDERLRFANRLTEYKDLFNNFHCRHKNDFPGARAKIKAFFSMSCYDTVLLFRTNSYSLIHNFTVNLRKNGLIYNSYSIFGYSSEMNNPSLGLIKTILNEDIHLSLRVLYHSESKHDEIKNKICEYLDSKNVLAKHFTAVGEYHSIFIIEKDINNVIEAFCDDRFPLNYIYYNCDNKNVIDSIRTSFRFPSIKDYELTGISNRPLDLSGYIPYEGHDINKLFNKIVIQWKNISQDDYFILFLEDIETYSHSLKYVISQYVDLFEKLNKETNNSIINIMYMVNDCLHVLKMILEQYSEQLIIERELYNKHQNNNEYKIRYYSLPDFHSVFINELHGVIVQIGDYISNVVHSHHFYIHDNGLYHNEIAATVKLSLGYYNYAKKLFKILFEIEDIDTKPKGISCFVKLMTPANLEHIFTDVSTENNFLNLQLVRQELQLNDLYGFASTSINLKSAFKFSDMRMLLTHECLHHVGPRNRNMRAKAIIKAVTLWLCNILTPYKFVYFDKENLLKIGYTSEHYFIFIKQNEQKLLKIRDEFINALADNMSGVIENILIDELRKNNPDRNNDDLQWIYLSFIKTSLNNILNNMLIGEITYKIIGESEEKKFDLGKEVISFHIKYLKDCYNLYKDWYSSYLNNEDNAEVYAYALISRLVDNDTGCMNSAISNYKAHVDILLGSENSVDILNNLNVNDNNVIAREKIEPQDNISIENFDKLNYKISLICDSTAEAFCDAATIKLLDDIDQYIDYIYNQTQLVDIDCYRVYIVLKVYECEEMFSNNKYTEVLKRIKAKITNNDQGLEDIIKYLQETIKLYNVLKRDEIFKKWDSKDDAFISLISLSQSL